MATAIAGPLISALSGGGIMGAVEAAALAYKDMKIEEMVTRKLTRDAAKGKGSGLLEAAWGVYKGGQGDIGGMRDISKIKKGGGMVPTGINPGGQSRLEGLHDKIGGIGNQRTRYDKSPFEASSLRSQMSKNFGNLMDRRLHSGDLNMINRRRRVQPRSEMGGARLSYRNTQPNRGTFGVGQGINR